MKKTLLILLAAGCTIALNAQINTKLPEPNKTVITALKMTDLTVTIDRIDDVYSSAVTANPRYDVHYTVTNSGTEDITGAYINLRADFYKSDGTVITGNSDFALAGPLEEQNEIRVIKPGALVHRTVSVNPQQPLYFDVAYKLVLRADWKNKIAETNENNNTAERSIIAHSDYPETDYFLTGVTFNIQTGNDNKEGINSDADFNFRTGNGILTYRYFSYQGEIKVNSTVSIQPNQCMIPNPPGPFSSQNSLQYYKQNGIRLDIIYDNFKFASDAWKINSVSVTLQFTTRTGKLSPAYGNKTISFPGATGILGYRFGDDAVYNKNQKRVLMLTTREGNYVDKLSGSGTTCNFMTEETLAHY